MIRSVNLLCVLFVTTALMAAADDGPKFNDKGQMLRPQNYREWIYLSSGLGMTYGPLGAKASDENPMFDNVFVNPSAYRAFVQTGEWPDKTVLVLEVRDSQSHGSINHGGHFQTGTMGVEVHVKDARVPNKWAFFGFEGQSNSAKAIPQSASCYSCHEAKGAVDTTFVQFYPTLIDIARAKHTFAEAHTGKTTE